MKSIYLIFIIPLLLYAGVAIVVDPGALLPMYPDADMTPHLAAVSLAEDGDLAYTREDSDRHLREYGVRPSPFRVLQKKRLTSSGEYKSFYAFYYPELFLFTLVPFLALLGFRGWLVFHTLLVAGIYLIGWLYYRGKDHQALSPALNSVVYFTWIPLPLLFLLQSHHLFLLAATVAFLFCGLRGRPVLSAIFFALAFSSQPFSAIFLLLLMGYWAITKKNQPENPLPRFVIAATVGLFAVWGIESLMYPIANISEPRWVTIGSHAPLATIWNSLPDASAYGWTAPETQRIVDFLFGRNSGFFVYAFAAAALLLSSLWVLRDSLVRIAWLFVILYLALISMVHTSSWNAQSFAHDFWILLSGLPYFLVPLIRPRRLFVCIAVPAAFFAGPLLLNPLGAIADRSDYTYSFPYRFLPVEISLTGRSGITKDPQHQQNFARGKIYFLNDGFYKENNYFWLRGESTLEFLLELSSSQNMRMDFRNGVLENKITLRFQDSEEVIRLTTAEMKSIDLTRHMQRQIRYEGKIYIHGKIHTNAGYVPGLLSRENPDFRFLSCQVQLNP